MKLQSMETLKVLLYQQKLSEHDPFSFDLSLKKEA
jgi:hypothetical protein